MTATDFAVFQRGADNTAQVPFSGALASPAKESQSVYVRATREDDQLPVTQWQRAQLGADGQSWSAALTLPAGGPYRLEAVMRDGENALEWSPRIKNTCHVCVGELWLLAGQSNMAGYGRDVAYDPPELGVHLFGNDGAWKLAAHPLNDSVGTIYPENAEYASSTSPALAFGRALKHRLGVPVGLIQASLGGSPLSSWHPEENGYLSRAMLRRIERTGKVGGVLWYQGCSDTDTDDAAGRYLERFARTVEFWRETLGDVPVATVQLNRHVSAAKERDRRWGLVREAQRLAERAIPRVVTVPANDLTLTDGIHNSSAANVVIGERLANAVLARFYDLPGQTAPNPLRAEYVDETTLRLVFEEGRNVGAMDARGEGMNIEDADGMIDCTAAWAQGNTLLIRTARPYALPAKYHAFWSSNPSAIVPREMHGMPMLSCYGMDIQPKE